MGPSVASRSGDWIVRGGVAKPEQLQAGTGEHRVIAGLFGFSVQYQPGKTIIELATAGAFPNSQISITTDQALLRAATIAGYTIKLVKSPRGVYHYTVEVAFPLPDDLAQALSSVFIYMSNPVRARRP